MEARTITRYVRMSPTEVGVVLDLIRGKDVNEASAILKYIPRDATEVIGRALKSAVANVENNHELDANRLFVAKACVGHGPTLERFEPVDHGEVFRINKRTSNITLIVKKKA